MRSEFLSRMPASESFVGEAQAVKGSKSCLQGGDSLTCVIACYRGSNVYVVYIVFIGIVAWEFKPLAMRQPHLGSISNDYIQVNSAMFLDLCLICRTGTPIGLIWSVCMCVHMCMCKTIDIK